MENLANWLLQTTGNDEPAMRSAAVELQKAEKAPGFGETLLMLASVLPPQPCSLPAATYFKNWVRKHWGDFEEESDDEEDEVLDSYDEDGQKRPMIAAADRVQYRGRLLEVLMVVDGPILKVLAEAFRLVTVHDFKQENNWPELVPSLRSAIQQSNLMGGMQGSQIKTYNAFVAMHTLIKPFQYLQDPTEEKEPAPPQLEQICQHLLDPSLEIYKALVGQAVNTQQLGAAEHDNILLVLCKAYHHTVLYHMPTAILANEPIWSQGLLALLELPLVDQPRLAPEQQPRLKAAKRALQGCDSLVTRHRKQADKHMQRMCTVAMKIVGTGAQMQGLAPTQERIVSLAFDLLASILETGPGWRYLSPQFPWLLEGAIFPALRLQEKDVIDWEDDEEEYLQKNLPSELDDVSGWRSDLYVPRKSAVNLLGLMAEAKMPATAEAAATVPAAGPKRRARKAGSKSKGDDIAPKVGEVLVLPFLNRFQPPPPNSPPTSEAVANYCGVVLGYAAMHKYLSTLPGDVAVAGLRSRVLPLFHANQNTSPYLLASACWLLGEYASTISTSEALCQEAYVLLSGCLCMPDKDEVSSGPVRAAAAGALNALLEEECAPQDWLPFLQLLVSRTRMEEEDEATRAYHLLTLAAEAAHQKIALAVPDLVEALVETVVSKLPEDQEEMWPDVVESGFTAIAVLCDILDNPEDDEEESDEEEEEEGLQNLREQLSNARRPGPDGEAKVANALSALLQRAWLLPPPAAGEDPQEPPPSALNNASLLLACVLRHTSDAAAVAARKVEELLAAWGQLLKDWEAWSEEEDEAAFEAVDEAIKLHARSPLSHFLTGPVPPPPAPPIPPLSPFEAIGIFIAHCISDGSAAVVWRACKRGHSLLHCSSVNFDSQATSAVAARLAEEAMRRFATLGGAEKPVAKPLVLLIATCLLSAPDSAGPALGKAVEKPGLEGVLEWGKGMATVATRRKVGLQGESECKLAALSLVKLVEVLSGSGGGAAGGEVASLAMEGAMRALLRLKEAKAEAMEEAEGGDEDEEEEEDEDEDAEDEDEADQEETERAFNERMARLAKEEEDTHDDEDEGGAEEDDQELELGVLALSDEISSVVGCLKSFGRVVLSSHPLRDTSLVGAFVEAYPQAQAAVS